MCVIREFWNRLEFRRVLFRSRERRWVVKSVVKVCGSTVKLQLILAVLSTVEVGGIRGVAVKCLDITKNSDCEGSLLTCN